ncbi:MAG: HAMP domain-containing histidine kinase [Clostridiales bacterium]|nr:HAMP domain-containing histidine kinase [Clostridiales bacterium]
MKSNKVQMGMLPRLLIMFTAVILLSVMLMLTFFALSTRQAQVDSRFTALKQQAYDIAYLASTSSGSRLETFFNYGFSATRQMLERKLRAVYEEYNAYCLVVERNGNVTGYYSDVISQNQELSSQWDPQDVTRTLNRVLLGEEVILQTKGQAGPMFTVAVPWKQQGKVVGAVYIQTAAQSIQASYAALWKQAALVALLTFIVAATISSFYTRRLVLPLKKMAASAGLMARGLPAPQVDDTGFAELNELSSSFNHMSRQIQDTENTRRTFIANLSHELRSPMTSIQGFVQGMLDETVKPENRQQILQIVLDETKRLNHLVSGLLSLSRVEAVESGLDKEVFNICELIRLVLITRIQPLEEKNIQVVTLFEEEDLYALAARPQIEQVLINLLDNAIRFTPLNGQIKFSVETAGKKTLTVTVRDNGMGVAKEDAEHIFDRFYKADQSHTVGEGVGLGLAICKAIMERHGQSIRLLPQDEGAAFQFTLEKAEDNGKR